jgi:hypothetical protein
MKVIGTVLWSGNFLGESNGGDAFSWGLGVSLIEVDGTYQWVKSRGREVVSSTRKYMSSDIPLLKDEGILFDQTNVVIDNLAVYPIGETPPVQKGQIILINTNSPLLWSRKPSYRARAGRGKGRRMKVSLILLNRGETEIDPYLIPLEGESFVLPHEAIEYLRGVPPHHRG